MEEREAIERIKGGDLAGMEPLVRAHQLKAVRAAYLITRDDALALDIVQQAFLHVVECIDQFDASRPFGPWFMRIVTNAALKEALKAARERPLEENPGAGDSLPGGSIPSAAPGPEAQVEDAEQRRALWRALGRLSPRDRAALVMRYYLELSEADMAREMNVSPGTIKWRLHQARIRLRSAWERGQ